MVHDTWTRAITPLMLLIMVSGCAATQVAIAKKNLVVQTKMSDAIFLDPVDPEQRTIFIQVRNTTDKDFNLENQVRSNIASHGYQVTDSPSRARYRMQAVVLSVEIANPTAAQAVLASGYGGAISGGAIGASAGGLASGTWKGAGIGGLAGAVVGGVTETVANSAVHDVTYMVVTDIELTQQAPAGAYVRTDQQIDNKQGSTGRSQQRVSSVGRELKYRTRIVSTANKVNLSWEEAHAPLANGIAQSLSGLF